MDARPASAGAGHEQQRAPRSHLPSGVAGGLERHHEMLVDGVAGLREVHVG